MRTLTELLDERKRIDQELWNKTKTIFGYVEDYRNYPWLLFDNTVAWTRHDKMDEAAVRDGSEIYHESFTKIAKIVKTEGVVVIYDVEGNIQVMSEALENSDPKLIQLYKELYPDSLED